MAEVLSIVAASAQLAETCLTFIEFTKKIKGGSSALRRYHEQLQDLSNLSKSISRNPLLQTTEIGNHTRTILSILSENSFDHLLHKSRFHRTVYFIRQDRALAALFAELEKRKTTLSLVISNIQSTTIHQIHGDIRAMAGNDASSWEGDSGCDTEFPTDHTKKSSKRFSSSVSPFSRTGDSGTGVSTSPKMPDSQRTSTSAYGRFAPEFARREATMNFIRNTPELANAPGLWMDCTAGDGVDQDNSDVFEVDDTTAGGYRATNHPDGVSYYYGCVKSGVGSQRNGPIFEYSGSVMPDTSTYRCPRYIDCDFPSAAADDGSAQVGRQTQGVHIRRREARSQSRIHETQYNDTKSTTYSKTKIGN